MKELFEKYDTDGNLTFNGVKFRPRATRTTLFGIDTTTPLVSPLRIHLGIDSGKSELTNYEIYNPFEVIKTEYINPYYSFGAILRLFTPYGFELRLMHMRPTDFVPEVFEKIKNKEGLPAGILIGNCGNYGVGTATHLHLETVSEDEFNGSLNFILLEKYKDKSNKDYTKSEVLDYINKSGLDEAEGKRLYELEREKRKIILVNDYKAVRVDYHTQKVKTFYNSLALFGF